mmetsp:Transcript_22833/g.63803  ORF Transcript_22833/g.63803 Transcript_22833/m.63803 type:complete len:242 (-) Transcript_22833:294-1019(-)
MAHGEGDTLTTPHPAARVAETVAAAMPRRRNCCVSRPRSCHARGTISWSQASAPTVSRFGDTREATSGYTRASGARGSSAPRTSGRPTSIATRASSRACIVIAVSCRTKSANAGCGTTAIAGVLTLQSLCMPPIRHMDRNAERRTTVASFRLLRAPRLEVAMLRPSSAEPLRSPWMKRSANCPKPSHNSTKSSRKGRRPCRRERSSRRWMGGSPRSSAAYCSLGSTRRKSCRCVAMTKSRN